MNLVYGVLIFQKNNTSTRMTMLSDLTLEIEEAKQEIKANVPFTNKKYTLLQGNQLVRLLIACEMAVVGKLSASPDGREETLQAVAEKVW